MQIQISWLLQKPTDLDLHCLQRQGNPGSAGQGLIGIVNTWIRTGYDIQSDPGFNFMDVIIKLQISHFIFNWNVRMFLFLHEIWFEYSLEAPHWGASNEFTTYVFLEKKDKKKCSGDTPSYLELWITLFSSQCHFFELIVTQLQI